MIAAMPASELRQTMAALDCPTQQSLADRIGVSRSAVCLWLGEKVVVPLHIAMLLRLLVAEA